MTEILPPQLDEVMVVWCSCAERYSWSEQCKHLIKKMLKLIDELHLESTGLLIKLVILKTHAA